MSQHNSVKAIPHTLINTWRGCANNGVIISRPENRDLIVLYTLHEYVYNTKYLKISHTDSQVAVYNLYVSVECIESLPLNTNNLTRLNILQ